MWPPCWLGFGVPWQTPLMTLEHKDPVADTEARRRLWTMLDWALWGHGVGDELRERAATLMVDALPAPMRVQLVGLFEWWRGRRGGVPSQPYEELRAELAEVRADRRKIVADTLRQVAEVDGDHEWADIAEMVEHGFPADWTCCPLCQEVTCDEGCALAPLRS